MAVVRDRVGAPFALSEAGDLAGTSVVDAVFSIITPPAS
jgi:hypothetical protein